MPLAIASPCRFSRCPQKAARGAYCAQHSPDRQRPSAARRGYGAPWQLIRMATLAYRPWCEEDGCRSLATDVHHRVRLVDGGTHEPDNLIPMCHACHSRITAREDAGISRRGAA